MLFDTLADYFERIATTGARLELYRHIAELLDRAGTAELPTIAYLFEARLAPAFAGFQMEMGERLVAQSIATATNKTVRQINRAYKEVGDLGLVAEKLLPLKTSRLTVNQACNALLEIAQTEHLRTLSSATRGTQTAAGRCKVSKKPARVDSRITPDVWVEPKYVLTVLADEITRSPVHTCAQDKEGIGMALRFPRVVGFIRDDKSPEDATTVKEMRELYRMQRKPK